MKYDKNKKYPAHKSKRFIGRITAVGLGVSLGDLTREQVDIKFTLIFFLIYAAVDLLVFIIQYINGRYAKVSFGGSGFTYRKYLKSEFVAWDNVVSAESISLFTGDISYYLIKANAGNKIKEYLIEKNVQTKPIMDNLYFKTKRNERILRLPFQGKQRLDFFTLVIGICFIGCLLAAGFEHGRKISVSAMIWIISSIILAALTATALYFYIKRNTRFKVNNQGVYFKENSIPLIINWNDAQEIVHFVEHLGAKKYHILKIELDEALNRKYDIVEVPVSFARLEKVCKAVKVVTK